MTARDEAVRRQITDSVYERLDPEGYGWAAGDHPSVDDVVDATLDAALPVLLDGLDREALARVIAGRRGWDSNNPTRAQLLACQQDADAVIAYLRDEFGTTAREGDDE